MPALSVGAAEFARVFRAKSPSAAMQAACTRLLRECAIENPPISMRTLLKRLDVEVEYDEPSKEAEAELLLKDGRFKIRMRKKALQENWFRTRFTIAHECGHVLLIRSLRDSSLISSLDASPEAYRELEELCNLAASELLMPRAMLREQSRMCGVTPEGLKWLRETFAVSREALVNGLKDVLPGTDLVVWKKFSRSSTEEKAFRVVSSAGYHAVEATPWLPPGCTERHVYPRMIAKAHAEKRHIYTDELQISVGRRRWLGRGIATFFPPQDTNKQLELQALGLRPPRLEYGRGDDEGPTIYLFVAERRSSNREQFLGEQNESA